VVGGGDGAGEGSQEEGEEVKEEGWSQTPPACFGDFWWWDGDEEHLPVALDVHVEMDGVFYASGNHGFEESMEVGMLGGWWHALRAPEIPRERLGSGDGERGTPASMTDELRAVACM
jgi:hypothetical protein